MEKKENTHPNPDMENISIREETNSPVISTEDTSEQLLPIDHEPDQTNEKEIPSEPTAEAPVLPEENDLTLSMVESLTRDEPDLISETTEEQMITNDFSPEIIEESTNSKEVESFEELVSVDQQDLSGENPTIEEELSEEVLAHEEDIPEELLEHVKLEHEINYDECSREELIGLLEQAIAEKDINAVKTKIALIKVAFLKKRKEESLRKYEKAMEEGSSKEELEIAQDELDVKFDEIFNIYKANKARFNEEQEKIKNDNLKKKQHILEELKQLISSEEALKKTYDEFKLLQDRWKEVGMVPRNEINNLWQNYHFLVEKFFEKVKLNKELKDLDLKKNLEAKIALCEKTEELFLETSPLRSFKKLQKYHEEWKEIGPVPSDKKDEIWERFKNASDKINESRREHYALVEDEHQKNLETKIALAEQAEELMELSNETIKDWQNNTNKVNEFLKIWKSIGPVSQKQNNEIWNRFKSSLDTFFANKKEFFDKLKEQQVNNYNLKVELCLQAESMKSSSDWKKTSNDLIHLQNEWKKVGPVPKKNSDKIWKRFRSACDEFFNAKSTYFSNVQSHEEENLNKKLDLIKNLKEFQFGLDKSENLNLLKNFQREWTDIGHIPIKEKDKLQNEFRTIVNEHLDRLKISEVEISTLNYQSRVESIKNDPNAKRLFSREREILAGKIGQMKEDINLWENNIGFLSKSKNAAILKEEFEKKINKAKSEVKVLEAKLKMLKQQ